MAITYRTGIGSPASANLTTSFTLVIPATVVADDILILGITCRDSVGDPIVTDDDTEGNAWAKLLSGNNGTSLAAVYWKRATSATASKTVTVEDNASDATTSICGALLPAVGVSTGVTPYADASYESNASTNETHAGFTPGANNAGIVLFVSNATNDINPASLACTDPGALTAGSIYGESTGGSDCSAELGAGVQTTAGATGSLTWAQTDAASMSIVFSLTAFGFNDARQAIINGLDSAQAEATGWDAEVKAKLAVTTVVRTSDTVVTVTLSAQAAYDITAQETITATIPGSALTGGSPIVASPTFTIDETAGGATAFTRIAGGSAGMRLAGFGGGLAA